jgi:hypothetical protein
MTSKNKLIDRGKVESMWKHLHYEWARVVGVERPTWRKTCKVFDAFIEEGEPNRFNFLINSLDEDVIYEQMMGVAYWQDAIYEGDKLLFEFVAVGTEILGNITLTRDRPPNEVRITQLCWVEGDLYGLDKDGVVFKKDHVKDGNWVKCNMVRADTPADN